MSRVKKVFILTVGVTITAAISTYGVYLWSLRPVQPSHHEAISFQIETGERPTQTAQRLKDAGLIQSRRSFLIYITIHGLRSNLQAGSYSLSPADSTPEIAEIIVQGKVSSRRLVIPEGKTLAEITSLAAKKGISKADFEKAAAETNYNFSFLSQRPAGTSLEGFLFPDSYEITKQTTAHDLITAMLTNFGHQFKPELIAGFARQGLSPYQGLVLASMVEREASNAADRAGVAQVFLTRLKAGQPLESDVTILYAIQGTSQAFSTSLDSPYNTYRVKGLPPGPICNPGISALQAVANPAATDYLYFVADETGRTHFAHTLAEHQANVAKYLK